LIAALDSDSVRVRRRSAIELRALAEEHPARLAPHFAIFVHRLDHPNLLVQWDAISMLARLAKEGGRRWDRLFDRFFAPIRGPEMITATQVIKAGPRIAAARPAWADRVAREIMKVSAARYRTAECRRIALGCSILALDAMFDLLRRPRRALRFVEAQLKCPRPATRAKAGRFLKRRSPRR
jgi:hypothetical protein